MTSPPNQNTFNLQRTSGFKQSYSKSRGASAEINKKVIYKELQ